MKVGQGPQCRQTSHHDILNITHHWATRRTQGVPCSHPFSGPWMLMASRDRSGLPVPWGNVAGLLWGTGMPQSQHQEKKQLLSPERDPTGLAPGPLFGEQDAPKPTLAQDKDSTESLQGPYGPGSPRLMALASCLLPSPNLCGEHPPQRASPPCLRP